MSRPLRIEFPGAYYHLMNRGLAWQEIFTDRSDCEAFLKLVEESHQMWRLRLIAIYVCRTLAGMRQEEIAEVFGISGYSAVSSAVGRMQEQIEKGGEIVSRYQRIQQLLQR